MKSVKVPLKELNNTRKKLMEKQLMNMDYKIKTQDDYGFIPINTQEFLQLQCLRLCQMMFLNLQFL